MTLKILLQNLRIKFRGEISKMKKKKKGKGKKRRSWLLRRHKKREKQRLS